MRSMQALLVVGVVLGANASQHDQVAQAQPPQAQPPQTQPPQAQPPRAQPPQAQPPQAQPPPKSPPAAKSSQRAIDPKADALLRKMSADLAGMKNFRFDANHVIEVVTKQGEKLHDLAEATIKVQRPNKLRSERMGPLGGATLYYDGKTLTVFGKRDNLYASAPAPSTIDETIDFARDALAIDAPGADLLYSDPYKVLMEDAVSGRYMGMEPVGDRMCHHLAYRGNETDWQIWIEDGSRALPCRFVITSKKQPGAPEYTVSTSNWREEREFPPDTFAFTPPRDAMKIEFVRLADDVKQQQQAKR